MPVSLLTIRLVYTQVFCFSLFYKGHFKLHHCSLQSNSDVQTFCTTASAERNTWLQFNLKLADRVVLSKELHLSVESIEAERRLQARESSPCPRNNMVVVRDRENLSNVLSSHNLSTSSLQLLAVHDSASHMFHLHSVGARLQLQLGVLLF